MKNISLIFIAYLLLAVTSLADQAVKLDTLDPQLYSDPPRGRIEGRLARSDGRGLATVKVTVEELGLSTNTDTAGRFSLFVPPGRHKLAFSDGETQTTLQVDVPFLGVVQVSNQALEPSTVDSGASHRDRAQRYRHALADTAPHAPIPEFIEFDEAVELARGDVLSYDVSTRGLGGNGHRRLSTSVDGRKLTEPLFGVMDWGLTPSAIDIGQIELERGPSSTLVGSGGTNGVLRLESTAPRYVPGGRIWLAAGERSSQSIDLSRTDSIGAGWYFRVGGSISEAEAFAVSRTASPEYSRFCSSPGEFDCLPREVSALSSQDVQSTLGFLRLDRYSGPLGFARQDGRLTLEAGLGLTKGPVRLTDFGRLQTDDGEQPWAAARFSTRAWQISGHYRGYDSGRQRVLGTGDEWVWDTTSWAWRLSTHQTAFNGRLEWSFGASKEDDRVDSVDPEGPQRPSIQRPRVTSLGRTESTANQQTLLFEPVQSEADAYHGQIDWSATDKLQLMFALRYDDGTLLEPQWSSRAQAAYSPTASQTWRLTYHEGFVAPSLAEHYLLADIGPAVQLGEFERICAFDGVICGFDLDFFPGEDTSQDLTADTRAVALGNAALEVESTRSFGLGYQCQSTSRLFWSIDLYRSDHRDLISDLVPALDTFGNPVNPAILGYATPEDLSPDRAGQVLDLLRGRLGDRFGLLTQIVDGTPVLAEFTYVNLGDARIDGADLAMRWSSGPLSLAFSYSWLDFEVRRVRSGQDPRLLSANAPENRASLLLSYLDSRWGANLGVRWSDEYRWLSGPFRGTVDSYIVADLAIRWALSKNLKLHIFADNLTGEQQFQVFGGALLDRRAIASLSFEW